MCKNEGKVFHSSADHFSHGTAWGHRTATKIRTHPAGSHFPPWFGMARGGGGVPTGRMIHPRANDDHHVVYMSSAEEGGMRGSLPPSSLFSPFCGAHTGNIGSSNSSSSCRTQCAPSRVSIERKSERAAERLQRRSAPSPTGHARVGAAFCPEKCETTSVCVKFSDFFGGWRTIVHTSVGF
jgi:hypothetical protein